MDKITVSKIQEQAAGIAGSFSDSFDGHAENKRLVKELKGLLTDIANLHKSIVPLFKDISAKTETQRSKMEEVLTGEVPSKGKEPVPAAKSAPMPSIDIAPGFTLARIIPVNSWREVPSVSLYHNVNTEEFGVRICGLMMSGKIGELYGQSVRKYLDCRVHGPGDNISGCSFYHDPARYPASKDRRGFPNRTRYESPSGVRQTNPYNLVAGSLSNLTHDLKFIKPRDAAKIKHFAMHWLLVALLSEQAIRG